MDLLTIIIIALLFSLIVSLIKYYKRLNKKADDIKSLINKNIDLQNKLSHHDQIFEAIAEALNSTSAESIDIFKQKMNDLAHVLRVIFNSEYCAIGKIKNKEGKTRYEDFTFNYALKDASEDQIKQHEATTKVMGVDAENPGYFITTALKEKRLISIFNQDKIEEKRSQNYHLDFYEKDILKSGEIKNTTIINIINQDQDTVGYIQFINTSVTITDEDFKPFVKNLAQLIQFSIAEKENERIKQEKNQLSKDFEFIMNSIKYDISDFEKLLDKILNYFIDNFNASIVSFRIPILNGKEKAAYFYLRKYKIDPYIYNQEKIIQHYKSVEILDYKKVGSFPHFKCYLPEEFLIGRLNESKFCEGTERPINTDECIILPVFKDMSLNRCLCGSDYQCKFGENTDCTNKYQNLFGIFRLRTYTDFNIHNEFYQVRLKTFSSLLNFLFDAIMDKNETLKIQEFQEEIDKIDFRETFDFEFQIASILKHVVRAKVCSIYWFMNDHTGSNFQLAATTSKYRYNVQNKTIEKFKLPENLWVYPNNGRNILSKAYQSEKSKYIYNLIDPQGTDKNYISTIFPKFIELPSYQNIDSAIEKIRKESAFAIPIKDKKKDIKGVVLFVGKEHNKTTISTSFWEQDRMLVELFTNVISRFFEAYEADKERESFLHQLGHELLAPIIEIVYENDSLLRRYERDHVLAKDIVLKQLKDNLNAAMYFKLILDDLEFGYSNVEGNNYNIELVQNPKNVLLDVVQMFEKKAHAEKQIDIRTNISNIPPIFMDKNRIQQVLINLIKNAIQYSKEHTTIYIFYKQIESVIDGYKNQKWHEIIFVNDGIGIPEEDKEAIFNLYSRSKNAINVRPSGTGIGLFIVKKIMRAHNGDCIVKRLNNPTEIAIYLPYK